MSRRTLSDAQWARIERLLPGKKGDRRRTAVDNRLFVDAILWLAHRLVQARPAASAGIWENLFDALSAEPGFEYVLLDATICKAHADASGAVEGIDQTIRGMVLPRKRGLRLTQLAAPRAA